MEKQIILTQDNKGQVHFQIVGFTPYESIGLLDFMKRKIVVELLKQTSEFKMPDKNMPTEAPMEKF